MNADHATVDAVYAALQAAGMQPDRQASGLIGFRFDGSQYQVRIRNRRGPRPSNITYVRWNKHQPRESEIYDPLTEDHPAYSEDCLLCGETLGNGAHVQLLIQGPRTLHDRVLHWLGMHYPAMAIYYHHLCLAGVDLPEPPT